MGSSFSMNLSDFLQGTLTSLKIYRLHPNILMRARQELELMMKLKSQKELDLII